MRKTFKLDKLIRDNYSDMTANGAEVTLKPIKDKQELLGYYNAKLIEEAKEVQSVQSREEMIEELADVCEIVRGIAAMWNIEIETLKAARIEKFNRKGGFQKGIVVDTFTVDEKDPRADYCHKQPEKYPEVVPTL